MSHSTPSPRHPEAYDGSMRELDMREVDRQWNQWIAESKVVQQRKRRRLIRGLPFVIRKGTGGHITSPRVARLLAIDEAINERRAITREAVTIELSGTRRQISHEEWAAMLEDEDNAAAIRAQAEAGEESQLTNEWEQRPVAA